MSIYCSSSDEEDVKRLRKLMDNGNADAFQVLGGLYRNGSMGLSRDRAKANELYLKGSLDVQLHITTWGMLIMKEWVWKMMRRKLKITMRLQL